ncbi:MAG: SET domain-containing protein [Dehalococcoidia bacterium]
MSELFISQVDGKGRGVFTKRRFAKGEVIELAHVIVLTEDPWELLNQTTMGDYYFSWGESACAIALGFGSLYNHSDEPNSETVRYIDSATIEFVAIRDIEAGEEITHKYQCPVWFEVR